MQATERTLIRGLALLFAASGMAALMDQVAWQRLLFAFFGVDLESVSLVVAAFMFGLGTGALVGGRLADRDPDRGLYLFALMEAGVGLYAWASPALFTALGATLARADHLAVALVLFLAMLPATLMMGATLPVLITVLVHRRPNVGWATGNLYSSNTLGASLGALLTGLLVFNWLDLDQTLWLSGSINLGVSAGVFRLVRRLA